MTKEEIIRMAQKADLDCEFEYEIKRLERFAALVTEHEREACAKVVEERIEIDRIGVAEVIRASGQA